MKLLEKTKIKRKITVFVLLVAAIWGGVAANSPKQEVVSNKNASYVGVETKVTEFKKIIESDGVVDPKDSKLLYVDRSLKVSKLNFSEGDYVKKGEVIVNFDSEDRNKVERNLKREKIELVKLERNLDNANKLLAFGGSTKIEIQDLELEIKSTRLNIEEYQEEMEKMVDNITSPFDGTITSLVAEENYRVNTEVELLEIADLSELIITAQVPEYSIEEIVVGQKVDIKPNAFNETIAGTVTKISTLSNADTTEATVEVEIQIDEINDKLRPGFNVSLEFIVNSEKSVTIPRNSLLEETINNKKSYYVYTINEDTNEIEKQTVEVGLSNSNEIAIKGIKRNTLVLMNPDNTLKDGDIIAYSKAYNNSPNGDTEEKKRPRKGKKNA